MTPLVRSPLLLLMCVWVSSAQAQVVSGYGVKVGVTAAELHNRISSEARWGATASLFATSSLSRTLDLLGESGYHAKGSRGEDLSEANRGAFDSRLDYAFLLVAPQYVNTLGTSGLRLFAYAGPRIDLFLGEAFSFENGPDDETVFLTRDFSTFVVGAAAGLGLDFSRVLRVPVLVELRYNGDLTQAYTFLGGDERVRNRTFDFRLGLSF